MAAIVLQFGASTERAKSAMAQLATSVASNMNTVGSIMSSTALTTTAATSAMGSGFGNAALAVARFAVQYRLLIGALTIVGLGIAKAAGDLNELTQIGDKANRLKLSPETFQAFTQEAERARIATKDAEAALASFASSTKGGFNPGNEKDPAQASPLGQFLRDLVLVQQQLQNSPALDRFLNAEDQNARLRATIDLVKELQKAGQDLAAQAFAEKAFGGSGEKIAEEIRKGKFALDELTSQGKAAGTIFSNELVERAVELRNRLEAAGNEIASNLKPLLEGSATVALQIGGALLAAADSAAVLSKAVNVVYQAILGAAAAAANLVRTLGQTPEGVAGLEAKADRRRRSDAAIRSDSAGQGVSPEEAARIKLAAGLGQPLNQEQSDFGAQVNRSLGGTNRRAVIIPTPQDRPEGLGRNRGGGGRTARGGEEGNDRLQEIETFIKQLEKQNRLLEAEVAAVGKSAAEREKLIAIAKIGNDLTEEQRAKIEKTAEATGKFRDKLKELEEQQRRVAEAGRFMGDAIADAFNDAIFNGTKLSQVAQNLLKSLGSAALKGLLTGQGPFGIGGSGVLGGLGSIFSGLFGGARAGGGPVGSGKAYLVGENGPELFMPGVSGTIIPNGGSGGSVSGVGRGADQPLRIELSLTQDLDARIASGSRNVAVQTSQAALASYDRMAQRRAAEAPYR